MSQIERNEETGIDARAQLGVGIGEYFLQTSRSELSGMIGAALTREWATGAAGVDESIEGVLGASWRIYRFAATSVSLYSSALLFPSRTNQGRYRTNLDVSLRRELVRNLYLDLSVYHSYDSEPPDATAEAIRLRADQLAGLLVLLARCNGRSDTASAPLSLSPLEPVLLHVPP